MHRHQINRLASAQQEKGYTVVPLKLYLKDNRAKVELGLARGKRTYDKRQAIAERESRRQIDRAMAARRRG
jgi:SsrA-binding protein